MVKRTVVVLGIVSLMFMAVGTSSAFFVGFPGEDGCGVCKPLYVPVECPTPEFRTIVKTWQCKIVGPCPAAGPACGPSACGSRGCPAGICDAVANVLGFPFDVLFGGCDGVYGCGLGGLGGGLGGDGPCGPCYGPIPCAFGGVAMALAAPSVMFGSLW